MADILSGLLSNWGKWTGNPEQDGAIQQGLLSAGLALMGGRGGNLAQNVGQAGMQGMQQYQQQMAQQVPNKLAQLQLQNAQAEAEKRKGMASLAQQYARAPGMDNRDVGQPGEAPGFDYSGYAGALAQYDPMQALQLQGALQKDSPAPMKVGAGESLVDPRSGKTLYTSPMTGAPTELSRLLGEMNALPANDPRRKMYMDAITKQTSHSPQVQVSYGQPVAGVDAQGNSVFFQPDKGGGAPSIVPNVRPAPQNRDTKLPAELQRMNIAADTMGKILDRYEDALTKYNPRDPITQANPAVRAEFQSLMKGLQLQFKEVQALGALAGPDMKLMEDAITDPFTFKGAYYGRDGLRSQIKQARQLLKERKDATAASQGQAPQAPAGNVLKYNPATGKVE